MWPADNMITQHKDYPLGKMNSMDYDDYINNEVIDYELEDNVPRYWFSSRFVVAALGFLGLMSMNLQRTCMSVAMICMINQSALAPPHHNTTPPPHSANASAANPTTNGSWADFFVEENCAGDALRLFDMNMTKPGYMFDGEFAWSETKQSIVYGTFYWGYLISQIPSGWLAEKFGGKKIFGSFLLVASASTLLIPLGSRVNYFIVLLLRIVAGIGAGACIPSMHAILGKWAPPLERSKMASIAYSGMVLGGVGTFPATSALCQWTWFDGGWPSVFYIFGGSGVVWFILWMIFVSETPQQHGRMGHAERMYLTETLKGHTRTDNKHFTVNWCRLLTSLPFLAIIVSHFCFDMGFYIYEKTIPDYFVHVIKLDYKTNEFFAMSPYLGIWFCMVVSGIWGDKLRSRGVLQTTAVRKVMQIIGTTVPATMMVGLCFLKCGQWYGAISMLVIGISLTGFQYNGFYVNHLDIAPKYAGIMMGISNAFGALTSFVAPYMLRVVNEKFPEDQWRPVFFITSAIYIFGLLVYMVFGRASLQKWASEPDDVTEESHSQSASATSYGSASQFAASTENGLDDFSTDDNLSDATTEPLVDNSTESTDNPAPRSFSIIEINAADRDSIESIYQEAPSSPPVQRAKPQANGPVAPNRTSLVMADLSESVV